MSRPRVYDEPRVATAIRLPTSLHEELQATASERDVSVNFLVTRAVSTYLAQLTSVKDVQAHLRHRSSKTTLEHYIKFVPASVRVAVESLDLLLKSNKGTTGSSN